MRFSPHRLIPFALLAAVLAAAGCSGQGSVKGKVTFNGKDVKGGNVTFVPEDGSGESYAAQIQEDATYTIPNIKAGKYKVLVETASLRPPVNAYQKANPNIKNQPPPGAEVPAGYKMAGGPGEVRANNLARFTQIPQKYSDGEQTPLNFKVGSGSNTIDLQLTP
jgi:type 1 fimbria pilin